MTIKTWEERYNAPGIVSDHITDHMQAEITELRARIASDAITMMRLAGMAQDYALKAKGLEAELAAIRNQQPIGYLEKHLIESGRKIQLCNLTKTRLWADSVPVYLAAGAQPLCKFPTCHSVDYQDELCKSLEDGRIDVPKGWQIVRIDAAQPVPESKTIATAPECLNTNDKAFWATGWNECRKAMLAAAKEPKCQ